MENTRQSLIEISKQEFQKIGHRLIDDIADFIDNIRENPVTPGESPEQMQYILGNSALPEDGTSLPELFLKTTGLLFNHSLLNGHPRFLGYITSSPAPVCSLADLLAAAVNPNVGAQILSPIATEIEKQTVRWLAQFIGVSPSYGGILVSGGNMANFTAFLAGMKAKASENINEKGFPDRSLQVVYCSKATHTWIDKAVTLFGPGVESLRQIQTDHTNKMDVKMLDFTIRKDIKNGVKPALVVGTAGDVSTGVVDDLAGIAAVCKKYNLWFHVDGAYGIPAAVLPGLQSLFSGIGEADSIAIDPHKWLYSSLEAGCTLVRDPQHLTDTFSSHPEYYNFRAGADTPYLNYYEYGLQNSRGFRALKVWMMLQQAGRKGYIRMISEDIKLSELLFNEASAHPELEAITLNLSITTLRYVPRIKFTDGDKKEEYLNTLNEALLNNLQRGGEVFLSNAVIGGKYCLRACIVNFRTSEKDIREIVGIIVREGRRTHEQLQKNQLID